MGPSVPVAAIGHRNLRHQQIQALDISLTRHAEGPLINHTWLSSAKATKLTVAT